VTIARISGVYSGEGPNTSTAQPPLPNDQPNSAAPIGALDAAFDRRGRLRPSTESAKDATVMSFANTLSGTVQQLPKASRGFYCSAAGTLQCILAETAGANTLTGAGSIPFANLLAGVVYPFSISCAIASSTTCSGVFLL
jgi:hypothetical protein